MKNLLIICSVFLFSCGPDVVVSSKQEYSRLKNEHVADSIKIVKITSAYDSLNKVYLDCELRCYIKDNRIRGLRDTLFYQSAQIANARKYLNICLKNPTQDKFLKGWIRRALE